MLVHDADQFYLLTWEDSWVENSTALLFGLTAALLAAAAAAGKGAPSRWLYIGGALLFAFVAGEEISWGQRLFGFETPDALRAINTQNEFNIHNIHFVRFSNSGVIPMMTLCIVASSAFFARTARVLGVPLPSLLLVFCFLVVYAWRRYDYSWFPSTVNLPLLFSVYALWLRERRLFLLSAMFVVFIVLEQSVLDAFMERPTPWRFWETREYAISIVCASYAGEIYWRVRNSFTAGRVAKLLES